MSNLSCRPVRDASRHPVVTLILAALCGLQCPAAWAVDILPNLPQGTRVSVLTRDGASLRGAVQALDWRTVTLQLAPQSARQVDYAHMLSWRVQPRRIYELSSGQRLLGQLRCVGDRMEVLTAGGAVDVSGDVITGSWALEEPGGVTGRGALAREDPPSSPATARHSAGTPGRGTAVGALAREAPPSSPAATRHSAGAPGTEDTAAALTADSRTSQASATVQLAQDDVASSVRVLRPTAPALQPESATPRVFAASSGATRGDPEETAIKFESDVAADGADGGDDGDGAPGASAGTVSLDNSDDLTSDTARQDGLWAQSKGGDGGDGDSHTGIWVSGDDGGDGGNGGAVGVTNSGKLVTEERGSHGIRAESVGGNGGDGGDGSGAYGDGGGGGSGGDGSSASVDNTGNITTAGDDSHGILAQSVAGAGGSGGSGSGFVGTGGTGVPGGKGSSVTVDSDAALETTGENSHAILAQSVGGGGGASGGGSGAFGFGGSAGAGADGSSVTVSVKGTVNTQGRASHGVLAQSVGGGGGSSAGGGGLLAIGGDGNSSGAGGSVDLINEAEVRTRGEDSYAVFAQSVGGGGGNAGGAGGGVAIGGMAGSGGDGGHTDVTNKNTVTTHGPRSFGVVSQSIGGGGGSAGGVGAGVAIGGGGGGGGSGGWAQGANESTITTHGHDSHGLFVQSVGGGGGNGSSSGGLLALGGAGDVGADGGQVDLINSGTVETHGQRADALLAQSVGGGGGSAGSSGSMTVNIGGSGAGGGNGGEVVVDNTGAVKTWENESRAIFAQSVGGGWVSIGGGGGDGGDGGSVTVDHSGVIDTYGERAKGVFAHSIGGGGGSGGGVVSATIPGVTVGAVAIGGAGGDGGAGSTVNVTHTGSITTRGELSPAITAESIGGGGGDGGFAASIGTFGSVSVGGSGGGGGAGGDVTVMAESALTTSGYASSGVLAQSVGGGGGTGGCAISGSIGVFGALSFALGGSGGDGGAGESVAVTAKKQISTQGVRSHGVHAQSVGGGGGTGGQSVTAALSAGPVAVSGAISIGGSGGEGGNAGPVTVTTEDAITTTGIGSYALLAQSTGGGGGDGGGAVAVSGALGAKGAGAISVSIGGSGGEGGDGGNVTVTNSGDLTTSEVTSHALYAESVGGGGGSGGFSIAGSAAIGSKGAVTASVSLGGTGGSGGAGGDLDVTQSGRIQTQSQSAHGLLAQSVGGGGGDGGFSGAFGLSGSSGISSSLNVALGGSGGSGGDGGGVTLANSGWISTTADMSRGILTQSIGGGGGNGGGSVTGTMPVTVQGKASLGIGVALGGSGGVGGAGGAVNTTNEANIDTDGARSHALVAQSVGGGGGTGGYAGSFTISPNLENSASVSVALGGSGGTGGAGGAVTVSTVAGVELKTEGADAFGVLAQSVGDGGGDGGSASTLSASGSKSLNIGVSLGGSGGTGGVGGTVDVTTASSVETLGAGACGVVAQSVGGGGGTGGASGATSGGGSKSVQLSFSLGGNGGDGGTGDAVTVDNDGTIVTHGEAAAGVFAQSVGGGGGAGGMTGYESDAFGGAEWDETWDTDEGEGGGGAETYSIGSKSMSLAFAIGGNGGSGSTGGDVTVTNDGEITTYGYYAHSVVAQSIGGGGGTGGASLAASAAAGASKTMQLAVAVGGDGGTGGDAGAVTVTNNNTLASKHDGAMAIFAQSVGGGGGAGGYAKGFTLQRQKDKKAGKKPDNFEFSAAIGGTGGAAGDGGTVTVNNTHAIDTLGHDAPAVFAQSVGGGGGVGGGTAIGSDELELLLEDSSADNFWENFQISAGGNGGASGDGNTVTITNDGRIKSVGEVSHGIFAQSVGGGGGTVGQGGGAGSGTLSIGGDGAAAGNGGAVTVVNNEQIETDGSFAYGIFAQSVGGGGGAGGTANMDSLRNFRDETSLRVKETVKAGWEGYQEGLRERGVKSDGIKQGLKDGLAELVQLQVGLGGDGGASGNGNAVTVTNNGSILTKGDGSYGVFAQSVGGGGGTGGNGYMSNLGSVSIGGDGGASGDGGDVVVTNNGDITTEGYGAYGIFAQSVGGGGGVAGDTTVGVEQWGVDVPTGGPPATDGSGGDVTVTSAGNITLKGDGCIGIVAQSVGGGGGLNGGFGGLAHMGSVGGSGLGGKVTVTHTGNITMLGLNSIAVVAQSSALDGADSVTVTLDGDIIGGDGCGMGFTFDGGQANVLNNTRGMTAVSGLAIGGGTGDDTVNNTGQVVGNVNLGEGTNAFDNKKLGFFQTGDYINLNGGQLTNSGHLQPGERSEVYPAVMAVAQEVDVIGDLVQDNDGLLTIDMSFNSPSDRLHVSGTADVDGTITPTLLNLINIIPAPFILTGGGVVDSGAEVTDTVVIDYGLAIEGRNLLLTIDPRFEAPAHTSNQASIGQHFNTCLRVGGAHQLGTILAWLGNLQDPEKIRQVYDSISPEPYLSTMQSTFLSARRFSDTLLQSRQTAGANRFVAQGGTVWIDGFGASQERDESDQNFAFTEDAYGGAVGVQYVTAPNMVLSVAGAYEQSDVEVEGHATGDGQRFHLGVGFRHQGNGYFYDPQANPVLGQRRELVNHTGVTMFGYTLNLGYGQVDMTRDVAELIPPGTAESDSDHYYANARIHAQYGKSFGKVYLKPTLDVNATYLLMKSFAEEGVAGFNVEGVKQDEMWITVEPALEFGIEGKISPTAALRAYLSAGFRYALDDKIAFESHFQGSPSGAGDYEVTLESDDSVFPVGAGIELIAIDRLSLRLTYEGLFGNDIDVHTVAGNMSVLF